MEEADSCEKNTDMTFKASTKVTKKTIRVIPKCIYWENIFYFKQKEKYGDQF